MPLEASGLGLADAVASATSFKFGLFVTLGAVVTIASGWLASVMLIRKRVLQDIPTALIRSASQGYVELQGYAELMEGDAITAPLSSRTCIWHRQWGIGQPLLPSRLNRTLRSRPRRRESNPVGMRRVVRQQPHTWTPKT